MPKADDNKLQGLKAALESAERSKSGLEAAVKVDGVKRDDAIAHEDAAIASFKKQISELSPKTKPETP